MKTLARISAFLVLGSTMATAQAHQDTSVHPLVASTRLQLIATTKQPTTKVGSPIVVMLTLKNISSEIIRVGDSSPDIDNETTVTDTSGKELQRTDWGSKLLRGEFALLHAASQELGPGDEMVHELDVTKLYQIDKPGKYYARWSFHAIFAEYLNGVKLSSIEESKRPIEKAFSNPIQLVVVE